MLWVVGITGAFITAIYTTRLMVVVFWGEEKTHVSHLPGPAMTLPLVVLAILSIAAGFVEWPHNQMHVAIFSEYVQHVLPSTIERENVASPIILQGIAIFMTLFGIYVGYMNCYRKPIWKANNYQTPLFQSLRNFWFKGWQFDDLYNNLFVKPFLYITSVNRKDIIDKIYTGISHGASELHRMLSVSQNGSLRWYIGGVLAGILIIVTIQMIV